MAAALIIQIQTTPPMAVFVKIKYEIE